MGLVWGINNLVNNNLNILLGHWYVPERGVGNYRTSWWGGKMEETELSFAKEGAKWSLIHSHPVYSKFEYNHCIWLICIRIIKGRVCFSSLLRGLKHFLKVGKYHGLADTVRYYLPFGECIQLHHELMEYIYWCSWRSEWPIMIYSSQEGIGNVYVACLPYQSSIHCNSIMMILHDWPRRNLGSWIHGFFELHDCRMEHCPVWKLLSGLWMMHLIFQQMLMSLLHQLLSTFQQPLLPWERILLCRLKTAGPRETELIRAKYQLICFVILGWSGWFLGIQNGDT